MLEDDGIAHRALNAGHGRRFGEGAAELGVIGGAVVALAVVLPDQLPVALLDDGALEGDLGFAHAMRRHIGLDRGTDRGEIRGVLRQADEDIAGDAFAVDLLQRILALVEILGHLAGKEQRAVELVGPLVVGADELGRGAAFGRADARTAMATAVVEGADNLVAAANDDDRIFADLHREIVAGARYFAVMADEQPVAIVDHFHIELEVILIDVEGLLQAEALAAVLQLPQNIAFDIHLPILAQYRERAKDMRGHQEWPKCPTARRGQ
ncbi:hypothetical protein RHSP_02217 [Rhizobium freirei PRF 81]|uniref:Uncharacterized protein n=1 Tax=Rhizobium freirei PRF 81 TaxID=363754 RepID=N6VDA8_9HYPH|nr:hypothetical protein RHSP_02217 [Rhizobium freirei PRF 81]